MKYSYAIVRQQPVRHLIYDNAVASCRAPRMMDLSDEFFAALRVATGTHTISI